MTLHNVRVWWELLCLNMGFLLTPFPNTVHGLACRSAVGKRLGERGDSHCHWGKELNFISFKPSLPTQADSPCECWYEREKEPKKRLCIHWMRSQWFDFSIPFYGCCYNGRDCHWMSLIAKIITKIADMAVQMHREWFVECWKRTRSVTNSGTTKVTFQREYLTNFAMSH